MHRLKVLVLVALLGGWGVPCLADSGGIMVTEGGGAVVLTPARLAGLAAVKEHVAFGTDHGVMSGDFAGPLLWAVLNAAHPIGNRESVRGEVVVTGADGYSAVVALGEIAPVFENKQVILATFMNGKTLPPGHFRLVVPGDEKGGRSVRDVVRMDVLVAATAEK